MKSLRTTLVTAMTLMSGCVLFATVTGVTGVANAAAWAVAFVAIRLTLEFCPLITRRRRGLMWLVTFAALVGCGSIEAGHSTLVGTRFVALVAVLIGPEVLIPLIANIKHIAFPRATNFINHTREFQVSLPCTAIIELHRFPIQPRHPWPLRYFLPPRHDGVCAYVKDATGVVACELGSIPQQGTRRTVPLPSGVYAIVIVTRAKRLIETAIYYLEVH